MATRTLPRRAVPARVASLSRATTGSLALIGLVGAASLLALTAAAGPSPLVSTFRTMPHYFPAWLAGPLHAIGIPGSQALRIGLVNRLYPPDQLREQTYAYARDLADFVSPSAIAVIKRQLYDVPFQTLAEATIDANREMVVALRGSDFREGVASFMEKRAPRFTGK